MQRNKLTFLSYYPLPTLSYFLNSVFSNGRNRYRLCANFVYSWGRHCRQSIDSGGPPVKVCLARHRQNGRETDRYGVWVWCVHCIPGVNRDYPSTPRPVDVTMFCIVGAPPRPNAMYGNHLYTEWFAEANAEGAQFGTGAPLDGAPARRQCRIARSTTMSNR